MKISLLVPTRMRPQFMKELWESVKETASDYNHIEIIFYIDDDDIESIEMYKTLGTNVHAIIDKRGNGNLSEMWNKCYGLKTTIFRYFQVFGENQRADTVIAKFLKSKKENKPITLVQTTAQSSFKTARRDFIYVKDIAEAMIEAAISKKTGYGF